MLSLGEITVFKHYIFEINLCLWRQQKCQKLLMTVLYFEFLRLLSLQPSPKENQTWKWMNENADLCDSSRLRRAICWFLERHFYLFFGVGSLSNNTHVRETTQHLFAILYLQNAAFILVKQIKVQNKHCSLSLKCRSEKHVRCSIQKWSSEIMAVPCW